MAAPPLKSYRDLQAMLQSTPGVWGPSLPRETNFRTVYPNIPEIRYQQPWPVLGIFSSTAAATGDAGAAGTVQDWPDEDRNNIPDPVNNAGELLPPDQSAIQYPAHPFWNDLAAFGGSAAVAGGGIESAPNRQLPGLIREEQIRAKEMGRPTESATYAPFVGYAYPNSFGPDALTADQLLYGNGGTEEGILNTASAEYIRPETTASSSVRRETTWLGDNIIMPPIKKVIPALNWSENKGDEWSGEAMHDIANGGNGGIRAISPTYSPLAPIVAGIDLLSFARKDNGFLIARTAWARDPANKQFINDAYTNGIQYYVDENQRLQIRVLTDGTKPYANLPVFRGGRAVNELYEWKENGPLAANLIRDTFDDPLFWITLASSGLSTVLNASSRAAALEGNLSRAQRFATAAKVVGAPAAIDDATTKVITYPLGQAAKYVGWTALDQTGLAGRLLGASDRTMRRDAAELAGAVAGEANKAGPAPGMVDGAASPTLSGDLPNDPPIRSEHFATATDPATIPDPITADPAPDVDLIRPVDLDPAAPAAAQTDLLQRIDDGLATRARSDGTGAVVERPGQTWLHQLAEQYPEQWPRIAARIESAVNDLQTVLTNVERTPGRKVDRVHALHRFMVAVKEAMAAEGIDPRRFDRDGTSGFFNEFLIDIAKSGDNQADTFSREGLTELALHADRTNPRYKQAILVLEARGDIRHRPLGGKLKNGIAQLGTPEAILKEKQSIIAEILTGKVFRRIGGITEDGLVIGGGGPATNAVWKELITTLDEPSRNTIAGLAQPVVRTVIHLGQPVPAQVGVRLSNASLLFIKKLKLRTATGARLTGEEFLLQLAETSIRQKEQAYDAWKRIQFARSLDDAARDALPNSQADQTAPNPSAETVVPPEPAAAAAPEPPASTAPEPEATVPPQEPVTAEPPPTAEESIAAEPPPAAAAPDPATVSWQARNLDELIEGGDLADEARKLLETPVSTEPLRKAFKPNTPVNVDGVNVPLRKLLDEVESAGTARTAIDLYDHLMYVVKDPKWVEDLMTEALFAAKAGNERYTRYLARRDSKSIMRRIGRGYDKFLNFTRRKMQFNLATGVAAANQDVFGNTLIVTEAGRLGALERVGILYPKGLKRAITDIADVADMAQESVHEALGLRAPNYLRHGFDRAETGQLLGERKYLFQNRFWRATTGVFESETIKRWRSYNDAVFRLALEEDYLLENVAKARYRVLREFQQVADRKGLDGAALTRQLDDRLPALFKSADLETAVNDLLGDAGQARHFRKRWTNELYGAARSAKASQEKLLFSYRTSNLDEMLGRVLFFHYWTSRALFTHTRLALSNWPLLAFYLRAWDQIKLNAQREGYPPEFQHYARYMADHMGLVGYIDYIAVATVYGVYEQLATDNGNGDGWKKAVSSVFMLNPLVQSAFAVLGLNEVKGFRLAGNTTPNLIGGRSITSAATIAIKYLNAHTGFHMDDADIVNIEERVIRLAIDAGNAAARKVVPGLPDYDPFEPEKWDMVQIKSLLVARYEEAYGPQAQWTPEVWAKWDTSEESLLHGGNDPMAEAAIQTFWDQKLKFQGLRGFIPGIRTRSMPYDQAKMDRKSSDPALAAQAQDTWDLMTSTREATQLNTILDQYQNLGSDRQRELADTYRAILNADLPAGQYLIEINGIPWSAGLLGQLTEDERRDLAWLWVRENKGETELKAYWQQRDDFKASQPMLDQYDAYWASRDAYPDDATWRTALANRNPAFKVALAEQEAYLDTLNLSAATREQRLQSWMSRDGYLAWLGYRDYINDAPLPTGGNAGLPVPEETPPVKPPDEDKSAYTTQLDLIWAAYYNYDKQKTKANQRLAEKNEAPPDWDRLTYQERQEYAKLLGKDLPTPSVLLRNYWAWAVRERDAGRPYSYEAYAAYLTREDPSSPQYGS